MAIGTWDYKTKKHTVTYEGCVLADRERNYYDDSDFYAVVWDEEAQAVKEVEYATTRFPTYENYCSVDATDEVRAKAAAYNFSQIYPQLQASAIAAAKRIGIGKRVRIVRGRKVPIGTEGVIFWLGEVNYGHSRWTAQTKIGISPSGEKTGMIYTDAIWTYGSNVEVVGWEQYVEDDESIKARAARASGDPAILSKMASAHSMIVC